MKIEIDDEVFAFLQKRAQPFVDTPNTVLRRLLLGTGSGDLEKSSLEPVDMSEPQVRSFPRSDKRTDFARFILRQEFGNGFQRKKPYQLMFESDDELVYFQNFEKAGSAKLWFRISRKPWGELCGSDKRATICFTNPAERICYMIPVADIRLQIEKTGWDRDYLEVNIDHAGSRWIELNWKIDDYLRNLAA